MHQFNKHSIIYCGTKIDIAKDSISFLCFVRVLKQIGLYANWKNDVKNQRRHDPTLSLMRIKRMTTGLTYGTPFNFGLWLSRSFIWAETKEGHDFWNHVREKNTKQ